MRAFFAALSCCVLSSCAFSYQDDQGYTRYIGFADVRVKRPAGEDSAAEAVRWRTLGLGVRLGDPGASVGVGYIEESVVYVARDAVIPGDIVDRHDR